jgi:hypothetical protein
LFKGEGFVTSQILNKKKWVTFFQKWEPTKTFITYGAMHSAHTKYLCHCHDCLFITLNIFPNPKHHPSSHHPL